MDLWGELEELEQGAQRDESVSWDRLIEIGMELGELGDDGGMVIVDRLLGEAADKKQTSTLIVSLSGTLVCVGLIIRRIVTIRKRPPSETQIL